MHDGQEHRVLLRTATVKDASSTGGVLRRAGFDGVACADMAQMVAQWREGAGALMLAEEVLQGAELQHLVQALAEQPAWSDVPVLLLARHGADSAAVRHVMEQLPNVTVIERPMRVATLVSALRSTLRARKRQYELRAVLADLQEADRRKTEFLATLAHELRNPLAPLSAALALLEHGGAADHRRLHEMMRRQVGYLAGLIDDLMEVSRVTRGKIELERAPVPLRGVLRDAVEQCRPVIGEGRHELAVADAEETLTVHGDVKRLVQIFSNLLHNAAKYTPSGGRIEVSLERQGSEAVVQVRDNGIGLAPDMLDRVFDMFAQASPTARRAQGGLGIGLTLVRNLVELHGGRVEAASPGLGGGATFTVTLPLMAQAGAPAMGAPAEPAPAALRMRVLVVDDNRDAADALAELLTLSEAEVVTVYDSEGAVQQFAAKSFDAAVLDIGLPGMDGCELAQHVRRLPGGEGLLLIALTGWGQPRDHERVMAAGFDHHLVKPADLSALLGLLEQRAPQRAA